MAKTEKIHVDDDDEKEEEKKGNYGFGAGSQKQFRWHHKQLAISHVEYLISRTMVKENQFMRERDIYTTDARQERKKKKKNRTCDNEFLFLQRGGIFYTYRMIPIYQMMCGHNSSFCRLGANTTTIQFTLN